MSRSDASLAILTAALALACGSPSQPPITAADLRKPWTRLYVPAASGTERVLDTPLGYFALVRDFVGGARAPSALDSYLYRSRDGVRWQQLMRHRREPPLFGFRDVAHGSGRFVMVGSSAPRSEIWTSDDGESWSVAATMQIEPAQFASVVFEHGRFFALTTDRLAFTSEDGTSFTRTELPIAQPRAVAFGNGRWIMIGTGPILRSDDGFRWIPVAPDCSLPGACINDPDGKIRPGPFFEAVFGGAFYVDRLVSSDGVSWRAHAAPIAEVNVGGYFLGRDPERARMGVPPEAGSRERILAWKPGTAPVAVEIRPQPVPAACTAALAAGSTLPASIDATLPGGETCATKRCVVVDQTLYLIP